MTAGERLREGLLELLYPADGRCPLCGREPARPQTGLCAGCETLIRRHEPPRCPLCGRQTDEPGTCRNCRENGTEYRGAVVFHYDGAIRDALLRLKFHGELSLTGFFARWMADCLSRQDWPAPEALVPVPTHRLRRLGRGFDLPARLAAELSRRTGIPAVRGALRRTVRGSMPGKSREQRLALARKAFEPGNAGPVAGKRVLLVDDITTTGATLNACAAVLRAMGAAEVFALTAAGRTQTGLLYEEEML